MFYTQIVSNFGTIPNVGDIVWIVGHNQEDLNYHRCRIVDTRDVVCGECRVTLVPVDENDQAQPVQLETPINAFYTETMAAAFVINRVRVAIDQQEGKLEELRDLHERLYWVVNPA